MCVSGSVLCPPPPSAIVQFFTPFDLYDWAVRDREYVVRCVALFRLYRVTGSLSSLFPFTSSGADVRTG